MSRFIFVLKNCCPREEELAENLDASLFRNLKNCFLAKTVVVFLTGMLSAYESTLGIVDFIVPFICLLSKVTEFGKCLFLKIQCVWLIFLLDFF